MPFGKTTVFPILLNSNTIYICLLDKAFINNLETALWEHSLMVTVLDSHQRDPGLNLQQLINLICHILSLNLAYLTSEAKKAIFVIYLLESMMLT